MLFQLVFTVHSDKETANPLESDCVHTYQQVDTLALQRLVQCTSIPSQAEMTVCTHAVKTPNHALDDQKQGLLSLSFYDSNLEIIHPL